MSKDQTSPVVRRAFADVSDGQVHYRTARPVEPGSRAALPLVMLHASPGSSRQLLPLLAACAVDRTVIAPDTRGNGDSTPLPQPAPDIPDLAQATLEFLEALGLERFDLYGSHTGASIATELALQAPERVRRLVLDGMGLYSPEDRQEILATYAPEITPDLEGRHLLWTFMFCRDQYVFWPWYRREAERRRPTGLPAPGELHAFVLEVLKAVGTYHRSYRAAFSYDKRAALPRLAVPTLAVAAEDDMLFPYLDEMASLLRQGQKAVIPNLEIGSGATEAAAIIRAFLDAARPE